MDNRGFNSYMAGTQLTISWFELIPSDTSNAYQLSFGKQIAYPIQVFSSTNLLSCLLILFLVPPANLTAKSGLRIPRNSVLIRYLIVSRLTVVKMTAPIVSLILLPSPHPLTLSSLYLPLCFPFPSSSSPSPPLSFPLPSLTYNQGADRVR